ncbi:hypothetical protein Nm8I071_66450 [Nonomuraea sp. TT08I-71]|nr:hypothetical protein Nm8I071_66450 [Nonomuraea sp. TT08I-71]
MPTIVNDLVTADVNVPDWVLTHEDCPAAVREAFDALDAANEETRAEREKVDAAREALEDAANPARIAQALLSGRKAPAQMTPEVAEEIASQGEKNVRAVRYRAALAAKAVEEAVVANHEGLRPILSARVPEVCETTARKWREMRAAYQEAEAVRMAIESLDFLREMRRKVTPEQRAAIAKRTRALNYGRPENHVGRSERLPLAWMDLEAVATGLPAALIAEDPYTTGDAK